MVSLDFLFSLLSFVLTLKAEQLSAELLVMKLLVKRLQGNLPIFVLNLLVIYRLTQIFHLFRSFLGQNALVLHKFVIPSHF